MNKLKYAICIGFVFLSGVVCCSNLTRLVPANANYEASWYKVAFSVCLFVVFALLGYKKASEKG